VRQWIRLAAAGLRGFSILALYAFFALGKNLLWISIDKISIFDVCGRLLARLCLDSGICHHFHRVPYRSLHHPVVFHAE
jgi:hypothetical protein